MTESFPEQSELDAILRAAMPVDEAGRPASSAGSFFHSPSADASRSTLPESGGGFGPGATLGGFRLIERLGSGGMGEVWEAEELALGRRVALKLIRPDRVSERNLGLFAREARAGGRMNHPGIVQVHAVGEDGGVHWISQELVEGGRTLRDFLDRIRSGRTLPADYGARVAALVAQVADALQASHAVGVIHRDVKPQNILIGPDERPRLTDFGLARIQDDALELSHSNQLVGTFHYMSPEQVRARRAAIDHRTDVFSLGVVLYELLALQRPFEGDTALQITERILESDPPDLRRLRSRVPADLAMITSKALEKRPEMRYATMAAFADDLRAHLANRPIAARPPSRLQVAAKWVRRHPTASAVGGLAIVALAVISSLLVRYVDKSSELNDSNTELTRRKTELEGAYADLEAQKDLVQAERDRVTAERDRLQDVIGFQDGIYETLDPVGLGAELWRGLTEAQREGAARLGLAPGELDARAAAFADLLGAVNLTTVSAETLAANVLAPARERIQETFASDPETASELESSLSSAYFSLGLVEAALELERSAYDHRVRFAGAEDLETLKSALRVARMEVRVGLAAEAVERSERVLEALEDLHAEDLRLLTEARLALADVYEVSGRGAESRALILGARDALEGAPDVDDLRLRIDDFRAGQLLDLGKLDESVAAYSDVRARYEAAGDVDGVGYLDCLKGLATALQKRYDHAEAGEIFERLVDIRRETLGDNHFRTITAINDLALSRTYSDDFERAETLYREAYARALELHDPGIASTAASNLSALFRRTGRTREAVELAREAVAMKRVALSPGDPRLVSGLFNLGRALRADEQPEESLAVHREAVDFCMEHLGEPHTTSITAISSLGRACFDAGDYDEAEGHLVRTLELSRRHLGADAYDTMLAANDVAAFLLRFERHAEALAVVEQQLDDGAGKYPEDDTVMQRLRQKAETCRGVLGDG